MMNVVQRKLNAGLGLHTKSMLSNDGKTIFLLIAADEEDIMIGAEKFEQNVQLELGWCDIYSMQPCDERFYPLMQLSKPNNEINDLEEELKDYFKEVLGPDDDDDDEQEERIPNVSVTPFEWDIYTEYLKELKMRYSILIKSGIGPKDHTRGLFLKKLTRNAL